MIMVVDSIEFNFKSNFKLLNFKKFKFKLDFHLKFSFKHRFNCTFKFNSTSNPISNLD